MALMLSTSLSCAYLTASLIDSKLVTSSGCTITHIQPTRSAPNTPHDQRKEGTHQIQHNLTQQHVLQRPQRPLPIILPAEVLERLEEIRICGGVVLVFGVQDTGLEIQLGLEVWGAVDRVCGCSGGG